MAPTHGLLIETQQPFPSSIFSTRSTIPRYGGVLANEAIAIMYVLNCSDPFRVRRAFLFSPKSRSTFECCLFQYRRMSARISFSWLKPTKKWITVVKLGQIRNKSGQHHSWKNLQMTSDRFDVDPKKVDVIREGRTPTNIPEVGRFLGFSNSYRRPVEN